MIDLPCHAAVLEALRRLPDDELSALIRACIDRAFRSGLGDLTHIIVVQPGDTEADLIDAIGFSPLVSRIDSLAGQPDWDVCEDHDRWWQLTYCVGDSGFAYVLFLPKMSASNMKC